MKRVLFICKKRNSSYGISYGLLNSCRFVGETLRSQLGVEYEIVEVVDNNCIDREVHRYRPTHVIIEALWVVPSKFHVLCELHPGVTWNVRLHSKAPFLANEGVATEWIAGYQDVKEKFSNFNWSVNDREFHRDMEELYDTQVDYLPNLYTFKGKKGGRKLPDGKEVHIGCFGAIRPLKNHFQQAIAAIIFADDLDLKLYFHVNAERTEQKGESVLKNLRNLFAGTRHELVEHGWYNHEEFLGVVNRMDMGMQVSLTETFNIVAADFISQDVPVLGSVEIPWMNFLYQARPTETADIVRRLKFIYFTKWTGIHNINRWTLSRYNRKSLRAWADYLGLEVKKNNN